MTREEAKQMFREDKDAYGKPRAIMTKIDKIFDEMEEKFTIEEIKNYLIKSDSFGDAVYFLSAEKIREANQP